MAKTKKKNGKYNTVTILLVVGAVAVIIAAVFAIMSLLPEKTPSNSKAANSKPEVMTLDEKEIVEVTAITGTETDKKGIIDKEGHRIYDTGYKNENGYTIYTTGKKDAKGNVLYTLNRTDDVGKLIYYTGKVVNGKLELTRTKNIPDYTSNKNSSLTNGSRYTTTKTIKYNADKNEVTAKSISGKFMSFAGGANEDLFTKVIAAEKGGFIAVGNSNSKNGIYSKANSSWKDFFGSVSKIGKDGKFEWTYVAGGNSIIVFNDVTELKDGSIVAVGSTSATDTNAPRTGAGSASLIVKLDKKGNEVWTYAFPCDKNENGDEANCVAATPDGGFIVGGSAESSTGFFKDSEGDNKAYLFKFDKKGSIEWKKILSGSRDNAFAAVDVNEKGEIFATCVTHSYDGNFGFLAEYKVNNNNPNTVVVKLSKKGDLKWSAYLAGWGRSEFNSIAVTPDGGCVVAGTMSIAKRANGSFNKCNGSTDGYVVRYSDNGKVYWAHNIGGSEADSIEDIAYTDKGIVVVGSTSSTNFNFSGLIASGKKDAFATVLNNSGNVIFSNLIGGKSNDYANSVCVSDAGFVIAGYTTSSDGVFKDSKANNKAEAFVAGFSLNDK